MKISAVIATYNRREALIACLQTLFDQELPADRFEIVVVVDGSTDGSLDALRALRPVCGFVVVGQTNGGQTAALNAGVRAATGDIVLFLDDDLTCDRGLLSTHLQAHEPRAPMLVFGRMKGLLPKASGFAAKAVKENLDAYYTRLEADPHPQWPDDAWTGPNCSVPKAVFMGLGGYDEARFPRRGEDVDLGIRLWEAGVQFRYEPRAVAWHEWMKPTSESRADAFEDGASELRLCRLHPVLRSRSALAGVMTTRPWKLRLGMAAATLTRPANLLLGLLVSALEKIRTSWTQKTGMRLFRLNQSISMMAGARREAGSWRNLRGIFSTKLAVLLYHHVGNPKPGTEQLSLTVTPEAFARHVGWLRWRGYMPITSAQWLGWLRKGESLPAKPVLITFDDAYAGIATHAFPLLERCGFHSTVFAISRQTGGVHSWDGLPAMTTEQLRHWAERGVEIGAHSRTHPDLTNLPPDEVEAEVSGSKDDLILAGLQPVSFAYPYGCFDATVRREADRAFPLAFTCEDGLNDLRTDPLLLRRTMVQPGDTLVDIELRAAFGWSPLNTVRSALRLRTRVRKLLRMAGGISR